MDIYFPLLSGGSDLNNIETFCYFYYSNFLSTRVPVSSLPGLHSDLSNTYAVTERAEEYC